MDHPLDALPLNMTIVARLQAHYELPFDAETRGIKRSPYCTSKRINGLAPIQSQLLGTDQSLGGGHCTPGEPPATIATSWRVH